MDDTWNAEDNFIEFLSDLVGDKFYNYEQKKVIKKFELNKVPESEVERVKNEMRDFYYAFSDSLKNMFGYVSYQNLVNYIQEIAQY